MTDGKPGHQHQVKGLIEALGRLTPLTVHAITIDSQTAGLFNHLFSRFPPGDGLPDPDLIIGAGHMTHLGLLAARKVRGGHAVVLMQPTTLPIDWFDLCIIPEHDGLPAGDNIIVTKGVLNDIQPSTNQQTDRGLILIGGPSAHHRWDETGILEQIKQVAKSDPKVQWRITDSRRTPERTAKALTTLRYENITHIPATETSPNWLREELAVAARVWVTEDSVSMVYEGLTSGAAVGLLRVPRRRHSRVTRGIEALVNAGQVTPFARWATGQALSRPSEPLCEADRCARLIYERWLRRIDGE